MLSELLSPILLTIYLAIISTIILLIISIPLAWWLARGNSIFRMIIESLVTLPLVLPPTVLGFYLLILLGKDGMIGNMLGFIGIEPLLFKFSGLVVGSVIYSFPFVIQPIQNSFAEINKGILEVSDTLGASKIDRFFSIILPLSKRGIITAIILGFAHTIGEFGVVLMIGGNIPGETELLSIAIYNHVENLEYQKAHMLSGGLVLFSFIILFSLSLYNRFNKTQNIRVCCA